MLSKSSTELSTLSSVHWLKQQKTLCFTFLLWSARTNDCWLCNVSLHLMFIVMAASLQLSNWTGIPISYTTLKADWNTKANQATGRVITSCRKKDSSLSYKVMFQRVSGYYLKAFELSISKYQLMREDFSKKACTNIIILLSDF